MTTNKGISVEVTHTHRESK